MNRIHPSVRKPLTLFALLLALSAIAFSNAVAQTKPDSSKKPIVKRAWYDTTGTTRAPSKDTAWVASKKGHTYYMEGCRGSLTLTPANIVRFKSEAEAIALGLTRSKQRGC